MRYVGSFFYLFNSTLNKVMSLEYSRFDGDIRGAYQI